MIAIVLSCRDLTVEKDSMLKQASLIWFIDRQKWKTMIKNDAKVWYL